MTDKTCKTCQDKDYWHKQAIKQTAAAGELRIAIATKAEALSKEIKRAQSIRSAILAEKDLAYVDGRIRAMQECWRWMKEVLEGKDEAGSKETESRSV